MNITVYLGSYEGSDPSLRRAVQELGHWIGESGNALVYGGSGIGLMGVLATSVLQAGGEVTGVEPSFFMEQVLFIAFPGGTGTLEEITEVMSMVSLGHLTSPCIIYNLNGYYDDLKNQLHHMIQMGLSTEERQKGIYFAEDLRQIKEILQCH